MTDSVKEGLLAAYARLMRPLVRILLRHGVSFAEFSEVIKRVYVTIAAEDFQVPGKKISKARIAIVTGLTRTEVQRLAEIDDEDFTGARSNLGRIGRVLLGWHTDPDYTGPYGVPLELPFDSPTGGSFTTLVEAYSGDMTPHAMLEELLRVGIVVQTDAGWYKVVRREYVPESLAPDFLERFGIQIRNFIQTLEFNMLKSAPGKGRFERTVIADNGLRREDLPGLDYYVRDRGQAVLEDIDNWIAQQRGPDNRRPDKEERNGIVQTGIGIYHYVVKEDDEPKSLRMLLEESSGIEEKE
ncbi:MAG: DUF6502 family protein [Limibacillus sp.]|jgi:hypothetical protein